MIVDPANAEGFEAIPNANSPAVRALLRHRRKCSGGSATNETRRLGAACHGVFYFFLRAAARASAMACLNPAASSTPGTRNVPTMKAGVP